MSIQSYDIQLGPAGSNSATQVIEATAQICDFLSSGSAFDQIDVRPNFMQGAATLKLGQGFDFGKPVDRWLIVNKGTTAVNGTVMLSTAGFRNFRISGDVNVLDGGKSRTLQNTAFGGGPGQSAVAGQYARAQVWNPAGSGVRLIVESIVMRANAAAQQVAIGFLQTQLAANQTNGISKLSGGAAGKGITCADSTATAWTGAAMTALSSASAQANSMQNVYDLEPIVVLPGWGLTAWGLAANADLSLNLQWYEEPNT